MDKNKTTMKYPLTAHVTFTKEEKDYLIYKSKYEGMGQAPYLRHLLRQVLNKDENYINKNKMGDNR